MSYQGQEIHIHERCPICGTPNKCQATASSVGTGKCWCEDEVFVPELQELVPEKLRNKACVCRKCVLKARRRVLKKSTPPKVGEGDFYQEGEFVVFTAEYLKKRGYCCGNNCRHCPYDDLERSIARAEREDG